MLPPRCPKSGFYNMLGVVATAAGWELLPLMEVGVLFLRPIRASVH